LRGTAANADAGFIYKPHFLRWLRLGCNYQNLLGGAIKWNTAAGTEDALGSTIKTGIAINLFGSSPEAIFNTGSHKVVLSIDYDLIGSSTLSEQTSDVKLGLEYSPMKSLALRLGCDSNLGIALGVGFEQSGFRFDYTYLQNSTVAGNNPHYFSIVYSALPAPGPAEQTLDTTAPQINVYSPKDKSLTNEPLIPVTGWVGKVHKKGTITTTTETYVTTLPDENGKSRVVTRRVTREIFKPTLIETSTLEQLADLRLNTKPVRHNRYGTFEASINLELGRNLLTFEALTLRQDIISTKTIRLLRYFPFSDMPTNHWAIEPIAFISTFGIINGYPDKTYKPTAPITRAELVTLLMKARNYSLPQIDTAPFKDVATTHWAAPYILMASQESLVLGYPDKTFKPKNNLTRAEGVTILARFAAIEMGRTTELTPFPDLAENHWAIEYVRKAKAAGMLNYLEKQNFDPNTLFSREEAAEILFRTPQLQQLVDAFWETGITSLDQIMPATPSSIIPLTPLSPEIIPTVPAITPPALSAPEAAPINSSTAEATPTRLSTGEVSPASSSTTETTSQ
jgi:hypothetical protein